MPPIKITPPAIPSISGSASATSSVQKQSASSQQSHSTNEQNNASSNESVHNDESSGTTRFQLQEKVFVETDRNEDGAINSDQNARIDVADSEAQNSQVTGRNQDTTGQQLYAVDHALDIGDEILARRQSTPAEQDTGPPDSAGRQEDPRAAMAQTRSRPKIGTVYQNYGNGFEVDPEAHDWCHGVLRPAAITKSAKLWTSEESYCVQNPDVVDESDDSVVIGYKHSQGTYA